MSESNEAQESNSEGKKKGGKGSFDFGSTIFDLWNGNLPLFQVFWLYYFAAVVAMTFAGNVLAFLAPVLGVLKVIWAGFMVKPIWLAADNYKDNKNYALLAKIAAVLIGVAVLGDLLAF